MNYTRSATFLSILLFPVILFAQTRQPGNHSSAIQNIKAVNSILDDGQKEKWQKIRIGYQKQRNEIQAKLKNVRIDLNHLLTTQHLPEKNTVNDLLKEIAKFTDQERQIRYEQQLEFRKLISDDQWQKLKKMDRKKSSVTKKRRTGLRKRSRNRIHRF